MAGKPESSGRAQEIAVEARSGQGDDEHASERTRSVRERARAGDNEGMGRIGERAASAGRGTRARLRVTQTKSTISHIARNRATVKALGLHGIGSTSIVPDNDATRGMVRQVRFLVSVEEIADEGARPARAAKARSEEEKEAAPAQRSAQENA